MNQSKINAAAKLYAEGIWEDETKMGRSVVQGISEDFKAGVGWAKENLSWPFDDEPPTETESGKRGGFTPAK